MLVKLLRFDRLCTMTELKKTKQKMKKSKKKLSCSKRPKVRDQVTHDKE